MNLPDLTVLNRIAKNNARIAPNATSNNTVTEHRNFSMAHPTRLNQDTFSSVFGQLNFSNLGTETNGLLRGSTTSGDSFHLTNGVLKFKGGKPSEPPVYQPPLPPVYEPPSGEVPELPEEVPVALPEVEPPAYPPVDDMPMVEDVGIIMA